MDGQGRRPAGANAPPYRSDIHRLGPLWHGVTVSAGRRDPALILTDDPHGEVRRSRHQRRVVVFESEAARREVGGRANALLPVPTRLGFNFANPAT
jgi:hypothetical protein